MGTEQVQAKQTGSTTQWGNLPKWEPNFKKEEEKIVIPFRSKDDVTPPVKAENKQLKDFYGLNIDPSMIKNIDVKNCDSHGDYRKSVHIDLNEGNAFIQFFSDLTTPNGKVYKDKNGYTVFENTKHVLYTNYDKNNDKIFLKNTEYTYLYTGAGADTIKIDNSKDDYISNYKEVDSSIVLVDGAADPTNAPSAKGLAIKASNVKNNLFWTENLKRK